MPYLDERTVVSEIRKAQIHSVITLGYMIQITQYFQIRFARYLNFFFSIPGIPYFIFYQFGKITVNLKRLYQNEA